MKGLHHLHATFVAVLVGGGVGGAASSIIGKSAHAAEPHGTYRVVAPERGPQLKGVGAARIIFLNRGGGMYFPGAAEDSSNNVSSIIGNASLIPPFSYGDVSWNQVVRCMKHMYGRFNVIVTDVDPGATPHIESVVGGTPADAGFGGGIGGVSPFSCGVIDGAINYTFAAVYGDNPQRICETVAQESAHSFGLDHEFYCFDPLTYLNNCGDKIFRDFDANCGENASRTCDCTGSATQNSVQMFLSITGPTEAQPPVIVIQTPAEGEVVAPGFTVVADVTDNYEVDRVELYVDGTIADTAYVAPFITMAPTDVPPGPHMIELRAFDWGANVATQARAVSIMGDCETDSDCAAGEVCPAQVCLTDLGNACSTGDQCASGLCISVGRFDSVCTQVCTADDPASCPDGFVCNKGTTGGTLDKCWREEGEGGCATAGLGSSRLPSGFALYALAMVALLLVRRRR